MGFGLEKNEDFGMQAHCIIFECNGSLFITMYPEPFLLSQCNDNDCQCCITIIFLFFPRKN